MKRRLVWLPLIAFVAVAILAARELTAPTDRTIHSAMIGKQLPDFSLPGIVPDKPGLSRGNFGRGKPRLLNVFASWCVPCIAEAPNLMKLKAAGATIDAVAIRDSGPAVAQFLSRHGDPYARIGDDKASQLQLALGSSGVPETFVIDAQGRIAMQHVGDIRDDDVPKLLAALEAAR